MTVFALPSCNPITRNVSESTEFTLFAFEIFFRKLLTLGSNRLTAVVKREVKVERRTPPVPKKVHHMIPHPEFWHWPPPFHWPPPGHPDLPEDVQGCGVNITPPCWKFLYNLPAVNPPAINGNSLGLYEQGDYFAISDLESYLKMYDPQIPSDYLPIPAPIDGADYSVPASNTNLVGGEADIDVDIA